MTSDNSAVELAAEALRVAMIAPDRATLETLFHPTLSYGHSNGRVDTRDEIVSDLLDGKSDFTTIAISEQSVRFVSSQLALVRHRLEADTNDSQRPGHVILKVLGVWIDDGGRWRMVARQAVRPS